MADREIIVVVEDALSNSVAKRLVFTCCQKMTAIRSIITNGNGNLRKRLPAFIRSAHAVPFLILTDLDAYACAPALLSDWAPRGIPEELIFRVAVREVESWLMADRKGFAAYLGVSVDRIPRAPESEVDPKRKLVQVARSASRKIREELVPREGDRIPVGPAYNATLMQFVVSRWEPESACENAPSLARAMSRLRYVDA